MDLTGSVNKSDELNLISNNLARKNCQDLSAVSKWKRVFPLIPAGRELHSHFQTHCTKHCSSLFSVQHCHNKRSSTSSSRRLHRLLIRLPDTHDALGYGLHTQHTNLQCDMTKFKKLDSSLIGSLLALCPEQLQYFPRPLSPRYE